MLFSQFIGDTAAQRCLEVSVYALSTLRCSHSKLTALFSPSRVLNPFLDLRPFASHSCGEIIELVGKLSALPQGLRGILGPLVGSE